MPSFYMTLNIEKGMPRAESAKQILSGNIMTARRTGVKVIKVIHGYGSSGKGGVLKTELRSMLNGMKNIVSIKGEDFSIFNAETRDLLGQYPELRRDQDLENSNAGITIVLLK